VPKMDLGEKQVCPNCGAKFYDLYKRPAECPKCHHIYDPEEEKAKLAAMLAPVTMSRARPVEDRDEDEDEDDDTKVVKVGAVEDEDEVEDEEVTREIDVEDDTIELGEDDEEDGAVANPDAVPAGFSEQELDEDADLIEEDDETLALIEDDDDAAIDDDLGDIDGDLDEDI
jgi:Zn-finger nucleic acid-binding protein